MKHWKAQDEIASPALQKARGQRLRALNELERWARVDSFEAAKPPKRCAEMSGAVAGLLLVATACAGLCFMLYQVTGPRDTFVEGEGPVG